MSQKIEIICRYCGQVKESPTIFRRYCDEACKSRYWYQRRKAERDSGKQVKFKYRSKNK